MAEPLCCIHGSEVNKVIAEKQKRIELQVRIPQEVRDWIGTRAQINLRSMNSEFIAIIRAEMARDARTKA